MTQTKIPSSTQSLIPKRAIWIVFIILLMCGWCGIVSGVGGWIMGYDLGKRETRAAFLPDAGVLVTRVEHDSPADQAGIGRGDIIIALNGVYVADVVALRNELMSYRPGDDVLVTYRHDLGEHATNVRLARFPGRGNDPYLGIYFTARAEEPADM